MMREVFWLVELAVRPGGLDGFRKHGFTTSVE